MGRRTLCARRKRCYHERNTYVPILLSREDRRQNDAKQMTPPKAFPTPLRIALFLFAVLLACPIRYWPLGQNIDSTWRYALNFAAAHHLIAGRDVVFTYGPLGYLVFPEDQGGNLVAGLIFQSALWVVLGAILSDLYFFAGYAYAIWRCLPSVSCWRRPSSGSTSEVGKTLCWPVLSCFWFCIVCVAAGGVSAQRSLMSMLPLLKLTAAMVGMAMLAGFALSYLLERGRQALPLALTSVAAPVVAMAALTLLCLRSVDSCLSYVRGSLELTSGYSAAMSKSGPPLEIVAAAAALALLGLLLHWQPDRALTRFFTCLLGIPVCVAFKHGFVRQDVHVINYFCFIALAAGMAALGARLERRKLRYLVLLMFIPLTLRVDQVNADDLIVPVAEMAGFGSAHMLVNLFPVSNLPQRLAAASADFPGWQKLEPEIVAAIGHASVASLSNVYTNMAVAGLNVQLYPVLQRYSAYTPALDARNAEWVRERGPHFLLFDGAAIDDRDAWAEAPAMWMEVYRWYDTRLLRRQHLLLERRPRPRFGALRSLGREPLAMSGDLKLSDAADFWRADCRLTMAGRLWQASFRVPAVGVIVYRERGGPRLARVIPAVLGAPIPRDLPANVVEFAAMFRGEALPRVERLHFDGPGTPFYTCVAETLH